MDVLHRIMAGDRGGQPGPFEDFWYQPVGVMSQAGIRVDAEGARKISAWYRGRDLLATALAMLPLQVYERLPDDGGADVAKRHPLYDVVHRKPNASQDSFGWRRQKMYHLIDHGNAYDWILPGARGFADQLEPIHPTLVTPRRVKSGPSRGRRLYDVRDKDTGLTTTHTQDEIFHLMGASDDGIAGMGILEYARDSMGTALATESYAAKIFSRGALNGGVISVPGLLDDEASKRMARSFTTAVGEWHLPKVLEQGATWTSSSEMTPEKAQMLLSRKYSVDDIARWLGVPRMMLENSDPNFGNAEQFNANFVTFSLGPWLSLFEFGMNDQLILNTDRFYVEFVRDALVRGEIASRWAAYQIAISTGTFTRNEVRRAENKKRLDGLDEPINPAFLSGKQASDMPALAPPRRPRQAPPASDGTSGDQQAAAFDRARAIAIASAARVLRKEIAAVQRHAVKLAADADSWAVWVTEFYAAHAAFVAQTLVMDQSSAKAYCAGQAAQLLGEAGLNAVDTWQTQTYAAGLAALALDMEAA